MPLSDPQRQLLENWVRSKAIMQCPACGDAKWQFAQAAYVRALLEQGEGGVGGGRWGVGWGGGVGGWGGGRGWEVGGGGGGGEGGGGGGEGGLVVCLGV